MLCLFILSSKAPEPTTPSRQVGYLYSTPYVTEPSFAGKKIYHFTKAVHSYSVDVYILVKNWYQQRYISLSWGLNKFIPSFLPILRIYDLDFQVSSHGQRSSSGPRLLKILKVWPTPWLVPRKKLEASEGLSTLEK